MLFERIVLLRCHAFIQASDERADFIALKYKIPKPYVINNYVPFQNFTQKKYNILRKKLNLNSTSPILFYSGGIYMDRFYGFENILKSIKQFKNLNFVIVGFMNNDIKLKFDDLIRKLSLSDRVYILPPVPNKDLLKYAASADIGVIPLMGNSINTELSALNKVSEYLMAGLPLLSSNYENLNKIVYDSPYGQVGETFNISSIKSILGAIDKIIFNKKYLNLRPNALSLAHNLLNWEKEEIKLKKIYETINPTT
jgi:glycosyltransferase involved in cell wall biosynthesis